MTDNRLVENWFSQDYLKLAEPLQLLHRQGGTLEGKVEVSIGRGVAKFIGQCLANKLNIPAPGVHDLSVSISHHQDGLHWRRTFNKTQTMSSTFEPVGTVDDGYWIEQTGPVRIKLTVDIIDAGWHWRCLSMSVFGLPLPSFLLPRSSAYKVIENGGYRFFVGITWLGLGSVLSYSGLLQLTTN